jgi:hypothetical protein
MFSSLIKSTVIAAIVIVAIIASIAGSLQLLSTQVRDESKELYNFVTAAKIFHEKLDKTSLLENIPTLIEIVTQGTSKDPSEVEMVIRNGALSAKGYWEQYTWLRPTTDSLDLYDSLIREGRLIGSCYSKLNLIWTARQAGNESGWEEQLKEVVTIYDRVVSLRSQNRIKLDNILQQFDQENNH